MKSATVVDFWEEEDFEEAVATALIACYESKIKNQRVVSRQIG